MNELNTEPPQKKPETLIDKLRRLLSEFLSILSPAKQIKNPSPTKITEPIIEKNLSSTNLTVPNLETIQRNLRERSQPSEVSQNDVAFATSATSEEKFSVEVIKDENTGARLIIRDASGKIVIEQG